jgi:hypothetical protein
MPRKDRAQSLRLCLLRLPIDFIVETSLQIKVRCPSGTTGRDSHLQSGG